jgi:hypothetical protein
VFVGTSFFGRSGVEDLENGEFESPLAVLNSAVFTVSRNVYIANVAGGLILEGRGNTIYIGNNTLSLRSVPTINNVHFNTTETGVLELYSMRVFRLAVEGNTTIAATHTVYAEYSLLAGTITVAGTLVLRPGTDDSAATYVLTGSGQVVDERGGPSIAELGFSNYIELDFANPADHTLDLPEGATFAPGLNIQKGRSKTVYLTNTAGEAVPLTYPSQWRQIGDPLLASLPAGKSAVLALTCTKGTASDIFAATALQV